MFDKLRSKIKASLEKDGIKIVANKLKNTVMKTNASWKTTIAGLIEGAIPIGWALVDAYNSGAFNGKHGLALVMGLAMIVKGALSKDSDKTGLPTEPAKP